MCVNVNWTYDRQSRKVFAKRILKSGKYFSLQSAKEVGKTYFLKVSGRLKVDPVINWHLFILYILSILCVMT